MIDVVASWGTGFWELIPFTMQMSLVIITGYVLASAPPMQRLIRLAGRRAAQSPRAAVAWVTLFALVSSWFNWGFSLAFSAVLAREIARRLPTVDYRALGRGQRPRPRQHLGAGPERIGRPADGQPRRAAAADPRHRGAQAAWCPAASSAFTYTIFLWQSFVSVVVEIVVVAAVMWLATPPAGRGAHRRATWASTLDDDDRHRAAAGRGAHAGHPAGAFASPPPVHRRARRRSICIRYFSQAADPLNALTLNTINLAFLLAGVRAARHAGAAAARGARRHARRCGA